MTRRLAILFITALLFTGCVRQADEPVMFTGNVIPKYMLSSYRGLFGIHYAKNSYAVLNREWVLWYYEKYRDELSKGTWGVIKWDETFTCTSFTTRFVADVQLAYFRQSWNNSIKDKAPSAAVGEFWYTTKSGQGHAIAVFATQNGVEFFDPQTGKFVELTKEERDSATLAKFN